MITGSHNPPEFNGFKTVCGATTIYGEAIQQIYRLIETGDFATGAGSEKSADMVTPYVDEVASQFHFPRRIKVAFDAGNGTGGPVMHRILERLNADATEMFFEMDGRFPNHHPDPTVDCSDDLKFEVVRRCTAELRARHKTIDVDGVRVLFPHGWGLVRASNTQPVLVMRFEATTPELLQEYRGEVERVVAGAKKSAT